MGIEWIKETMELIEGMENEYQTLRNKYEQIANELMDLERNIQFGHELIRNYMNKHNITSVEPRDIKLGSLANKSYPKMIEEIAQKSNGILNEYDVVEIISKEYPSISKETIKHNVRNAVYRKRKNYIRIGKGQYRYTNGIQTVRAKQKKSKRRHGSNSGVQAAIQEMKNKNPQITKKEVLKHLFDTGFDFKGKNPAKAVNIVWAKLGYSKEGKQQILPGIDAHRLAMLGLKEKQREAK
jgi:hypothetical protein